MRYLMMSKTSDSTPDEQLYAEFGPAPGPVPADRVPVEVGRRVGLDADGLGRPGAQEGGRPNNKRPAAQAKAHECIQCAALNGPAQSPGCDHFPDLLVGSGPGIFYAD